MLSHLVIVVIGIFTNGDTGESVQAMAQVPSVTACAELINENRYPHETADGTWYLTKAECKVIEVKGK